MSENIGKIIGVNGNLLKVKFNMPVIQNEVAYACVGELKLKAEVSIVLYAFLLRDIRFEVRYLIFH